MPSIRPSYQSLISVFQQGVLLLRRGRAGGGDAAANAAVTAPTMQECCEDVPKRMDHARRTTAPIRAPARCRSRAALYVMPRAARLETSLATRRERAVSPRLRVC